MEAHQVDVLKKRLRELNTHQASIQTLSLWIAHHHKDCEKIAKIWAQVGFQNIFIFNSDLRKYARITKVGLTGCWLHSMLQMM